MAHTYGSLFAGIGGFDLALERAGLRCLWQVEIDKDAQRVLRRHWPDALLLSDVREVGKRNLPRVDVITFGSPCQDLSVAGKRQGLKGKRSNLFYEAIRVVRQLRPAFAVFENVPSALSSFSGDTPPDGGVLPGRGWETEEESDFGLILSAFQRCGARDIAWRVVDAQYFGLAQRRERVFVVADFRGERAAEILFESPCGCGHPPSRGQEEQGTAPSVTPGARRASGNRSSEQLTVSGTLGSCGNGRGFNDDLDRAGAFVVPTLTGSGDAHSGFRLGDGQTVTEPETFHANGAGSFRAGSPTLASSDDNGTNHIICFQQSSMDGKRTMGVDVNAKVSKQVKTQPDGQMVAYQCQGNNVGPMGTLREGTGGGGQKANLVAYTVQATFSEGQGPHAREAETSKCLDAHGGDPDCQQGGTVVAFQERGRADGPNLESQTELAYSMNAPAGGGRRQEMNVQTGMSVRRLMPVECCRLQGFPDDHLDLDPPLSDSAKYRLLGNAVAVPVAEWIGRRLLQAMLRSGPPKRKRVDHA